MPFFRVHAYAQVSLRLIAQRASLRGALAVLCRACGKEKGEQQGEQEEVLAEPLLTNPATALKVSDARQAHGTPEAAYSSGQ